MPLRRFSPGLKAQFAFGMVFLFVQPDASAADISAQQIGGVIIPQAFSQALQDGMSVPLYIHLAGSQGRQDDQRIGSAFIWLDDGQLRIRKIQLEESEDNASVSEQTRQQLMCIGSDTSGIRFIFCIYNRNRILRLIISNNDRNKK